jgi:formylglycine-generating enzyme required for sulfatase activity
VSLNRIDKRILRIAVAGLGTILVIILVLMLAITKTTALSANSAVATSATPTPTSAPPTPMPMVNVPAGDFIMGSSSSDAQASSDEKPQHTVYLDAFQIDKYEVTNALYKQCVDAGMCYLPSTLSSYARSTYYGDPSFDNYPVINVSWYDARAYCEWAGKQLPTEAQWEKAARGTDGRIYPWGNTWDVTKLNSLVSSPSVGDTTAVGSYPTGASLYGALDMAGNVWEWVADWHDPNYYSHSPLRDPQGPSSGLYKVLRGGSWDNGMADARAANRDFGVPAYYYAHLGFRCVK